MNFYKYILMLCSALLSIGFGFSQTCPTSDFPPYYNCQDIEQFVADYPDCSRLPSTLRLPYVSGDLTGYAGLSQIDSISGTVICDECDLSSLIGLENLRYIGGDFTLDEPHGPIENLEGLNELTYIGGSLNIWETKVFTSTSGLDNLDYLGNKIEFRSNDSLVDIVGFDQISVLPGGLWLEENYLLNDLSAFISLTSVGGNLRLWENTGLTSVQGLNNLESVWGDFYIDDSPLLKNLDELFSLKSIGGALIITDNPSLDNITALSSVETFNGQIFILYNDLLSSLAGLENISANNISNLTIFDCDTLSFCSLKNICQYLSEDLGPASISMNSNGCNTEFEIIENCSTVELSPSPASALLEVYPNPIKQDAVLLFDSQWTGVDVHIYDTNGVLVRNYTDLSGPQLELDRRDLPKGLYLLMLFKDKEAVASSRIVFQ